MYTDLCSWENLLLAYQRASRGKRGLPHTAAFEYRLEDQLLRLQDELENKTYTPGRYSSFYIHEPKQRLISAAPFRDRVVHHALCNLIEPVFERSFIYDSYANRVGKGTHRALDRAQNFSRRYPYVLQCDLRQFFPSIDHAILLNTLARKIGDTDVMWLCSQILRSGVGVLSEQYDMVYFPGDDLFASLMPRGLPIGNLTSQFWANVYMNPFDHFVKRELRCGAFLRYVDDFLLFSDNKVELWEYKRAIELRLAKLRLTLHLGTQPQLTARGFPFLGFRIYPDRRRLKRKKALYYQRKLHNLLVLYGQGVIPLEKVHTSVAGWVNHARYGNTVGLRKAIFKRSVLHG